jgi:hypothetical protein
LNGSRASSNADSSGYLPADADAARRALRTLARIRAEDKQAFTSIRPALAALAEQPHPDQAAAWGGSGIYRLRLPGIRILDEVNEDQATQLRHQRRRHRVTSDWMTSGIWHPTPERGAHQLCQHPA